jgi:hypothetical protein
VELVWCDWAGERYEALAFERRIKKRSRAKKEALIAGDWQQVGYFAKPPRERPSTSLGTNECGGRPQTPNVRNAQDSFVPSVVEGRPTAPRDPQ